MSSHDSGYSSQTIITTSQARTGGNSTFLIIHCSKWMANAKRAGSGGHRNLVIPFYKSLKKIVLISGHILIQSPPMCTMFTAAWSHVIRISCCYPTPLHNTCGSCLSPAFPILTTVTPDAKQFNVKRF